MSMVKADSKRDINMQVLDCFIAKKAINHNCSLTFEEINVPISNEIKQILLKNLIKDGFIVVKADQTMWFHKEKWDVTVKDLSNKYFMILALPIIAVTGLMFVMSLL